MQKNKLKIKICRYCINGANPQKRFINTALGFPVGMLHLKKISVVDFTCSSDSLREQKEFTLQKRVFCLKF